MNWANGSLLLEGEDESKADHLQVKHNIKTKHDQNEQKKLIQLQKYKDPRNNGCRKNYISIMSKFGELLMNNNKEELARTLLAEDCESFLFNFAETSPVHYTFKSDEFIDLHQDFQVTQRDVNETFFDLENSTAFQVCSCKIKNKKDGSLIDQFSFESFSFKDGKISKYKASFGTTDESQNPLEPSRKDRMLAKVKELNYAWADQPDLDKIASLLHDSTEYKIWRWDDRKGFTLSKKGFVADFSSLEEYYEVKCVVPYEVYSEGQFIMGSYVYHLEGKNELTGQKHMWISTCLYTFDKDLNIKKVVQQGEMYNEDEILIPFEVQTRETLKEKIEKVYKAQQDQSASIFCSEEVQFSFEMHLVGPSYSLVTGRLKGFGEYAERANGVTNKHQTFEFAKAIDIFIDENNLSYETVILIDCAKGTVNKEGYPYDGKLINFYSIRKLSFENGKLAKLVMFFSDIPEAIPSPYDDKEFVDHNIRPKSEFL